MTERKYRFLTRPLQVVISLFVLQYIADPVAFLSELRRTGRGRLLIIQSVYAGVLGEVVLRAREFVQGRGAFRAARALKLVPNGADRMRPVHFYTLEELQAVFERAELEVVEHHRLAMAWAWGEPRPICAGMELKHESFEH